MTAYTHTSSAAGLEQMAQGVQTSIDSAVRAGAGVSRSPAFGALRRACQRCMAALIASREAHALAEIERLDPRLGAEIRAAKDRAERVAKA